MPAILVSGHGEKDCVFECAQGKHAHSFDQHVLSINKVLDTVPGEDNTVIYKV